MAPTDEPGRGATVRRGNDSIRQAIQRPSGGAAAAAGERGARDRNSGGGGGRAGGASVEHSDDFGSLKRLNCLDCPHRYSTVSDGPIARRRSWPDEASVVHQVRHGSAAL